MNILEIGLQQGREMGIQQGIEEGIRQGIRQGIEEGIQQGEEEAMKRIVRNMLAQNMPVEEIMKLTACTPEMLAEVKEEQRNS